jgi:hypothetical protein
MENVKLNEIELGSESPPYNMTPVVEHELGVKITKEISTDVAIPQSIKTEHTFNGFTYHKLIPAVQRKEVALTEDDDSIGFIFYRGLQFGLKEDSSGGMVGFNYPMGATDVYDSQGLKIANYSLAYNGNYGLHELWWKDWLSFLKNTKMIKTRLFWSVNDLLTADLTKKYFDNGNLFFIKKLKIKLSKHSIENITAEMMKI